jgi:hypothetical protein
MSYGCSLCRHERVPVHHELSQSMKPANKFELYTVFAQTDGIGIFCRKAQSTAFPKSWSALCAVLNILHTQNPINLISRLFVGMGSKQGLYRVFDHGILTDHFHFVFFHFFQPMRLAQIRSAVFQWPELALARHLPAALVISLIASCACGEQSVFDRFEVGFRYIKTQFIHDRKNEPEVFSVRFFESAPERVALRWIGEILTPVWVEIGVDIGRIGAVGVITGKGSVATFRFMAVMVRTGMMRVIAVWRIADIRT